MSRVRGKELRELAREVRAAGYRVEQAGTHLAIRNAEGKRVGTLPCNAGDYRQLRNLRAQFRRSGILT